MKNLFAKLADPRYAKVAWLVLGLIGLIIAGGAPTPARADGPGTNGSAFRAIAFLHELETGRRTELPVDVQIEDAGDGRITVTYVAKVPRAYWWGRMFADKVTLDDKTVGKYDSTWSVKATLTQVYWEKVIGGYTYVSVDYYRGKWEKFDGTVSWRDARLTASVYGQPESGPFLYRTEMQWVGVPSIGQWYYQYPGWRGTYVRIDEIAYQAGRTDITLYRGGSTWSLGFCISQGGQQQMNCY